MNILVIGSGGREHAIVRKLKESPKTDRLWCAPGNGGIAADAECVDIGAMDIDGVVQFAQENPVDLVFVAPDDPLAAGMVDALEAQKDTASCPGGQQAMSQKSGGTDGSGSVVTVRAVHKSWRQFLSVKSSIYYTGTRRRLSRRKRLSLCSDFTQKVGS